MTSERETLERRARDLARPPARLAPGEMIEVVEFTIASERFAIRADAIEGAFALRTMTPLPGASLPLLGMTLWRGALVAILDVRAALGLSSGALNDLRMVLLLAHANGRTGILVDAIIGARARRADEFTTSEGGQGTVGPGRMSKDAVTLIDGAELLSHQNTGGPTT